jgi:hypothetical protein
MVAFLLGVVLLIWIPVEDLGEAWVLLLAAGICMWGAIRVWVSIAENRDIRAWHFALIGTVTGLAVPVLGTALMVFKSGLHSHQSPEFSAAQIGGLLLRTPYWGVGGFIIGAGLGILYVLRIS